MDKYGLDIPVTLDDFVNVLRVFKENGVKYPYVGREKFMYTDTFFGAFNAVPTTWLENENGEVGIFQRNVINFTQMQARLEQAVLDGEFLMIPGPTGEDGGHGVAEVPSYMRVFMINRNVENPERIRQFFDYMGTQEAVDFFSFGIEGEDYTKNEDGTVNFEYPTDTAAMGEIQYRAEWLWGVRDSAYNK